MMQARQLYDMAVVYKEVDVDAKFPDIPVEHLGVCSLKHDLVPGKLLHDARDDIGSPRADVLGDALGLDHQTLNTGIEELVAQVDEFAGVGGADGFQASNVSVTTSTKLNAQLGLSLELIRVHLVYKAEPVLFGDGEETERKFDDIEAMHVSISPRRKRMNR